MLKSNEFNKNAVNKLADHMSPISLWDILISNDEKLITSNETFLS